MVSNNVTVKQDTWNCGQY